MLEVHRAAWVLPIAGPPIRNGWVSVDAGRIAAVGSWGQTPLSGSGIGGQTPIVILPGLVNAHVHLELSWMRGMVPPGDAMPAWAARLIGVRRAAGADAPGPIADAIADAQRFGTALVGDVTNSLAACDALRQSDLDAAVFFELIGFTTPDAPALVADALARLDQVAAGGRLRATVAPHAPYSVSPALLRAIAAAARGRPLSIHLGESPEEVRFLDDGSGAWRDLLERIGAWSPTWQPPACGPVEYLDRLGLVNGTLIAVHATQLDDRQLQTLAGAGATVVTCPRSNRWTGAGTPPVSRFYASGVRVAIGTDSLASVDDLSVFAEMAAVRRLAPDVSARRILRSATLDGAAALGFGAELGSIEPGKRARLLAVAIPDAVEDVEEYLVSGVSAADVSWLTAAPAP
jgi:cytosine/adenosine deaminase-related metal-dependent hydrolase